MSRSTIEDQMTIEMILELLALLGGFSLLLFLYTHKGKILRPLLFIFASRRRRAQSMMKDVENGNTSDQGLTSTRKVQDHTHSTSLARIQAYLRALPTDSHEFISMREVSTRVSEEDSEGNERSRRRSRFDDGPGEGDYDASEESLESNWVEIIRDFPQPPGLKSLEPNGTSSIVFPGIIETSSDDIENEDKVEGEGSRDIFKAKFCVLDKTNAICPGSAFSPQDSNHSLLLAAGLSTSRLQ